MAGKQVYQICESHLVLRRLSIKLKVAVGHHAASYFLEKTLSDTFFLTYSIAIRNVFPEPPEVFDGTQLFRLMSTDLKPRTFGL